MFKASPFGIMADIVVRSGKLAHYHPLLAIPPPHPLSWSAKYSLVSRNVEISLSQHGMCYGHRQAAVFRREMPLPVVNSVTSHKQDVL